MSLVTSGQFRTEMLEHIQKLITMNIDKLENMATWKNFFKAGKTKYEQYETKIDEASGPAQIWVEGSPRALIELNDGWVKRRAITEYGAMIAYTKRVKKMGNRRLIGKMAKVLSMAIPMLKEEICANYLEYGDLAISSVPTVDGMPIIDTVAADGQPLFSTSHTHYSDQLGTWSNKTATFLSMNMAALQSMSNIPMEWVNNNGQPMEVVVKKLWVGIPNRHKAYELLHSAGNAETANRADNALRQDFGEMDFGVYKRMKDPYEFFMTTTAENDFCYDEAWGIESDQEYDKLTGTTYLMRDTAFAHGAGDTHYIVANKR